MVAKVQCLILAKLLVRHLIFIFHLVYVLYENMIDQKKLGYHNHPYPQHSPSNPLPSPSPLPNPATSSEGPVDIGKNKRENENTPYRSRFDSVVPWGERSGNGPTNDISVAEQTGKEENKKVNA